MLTNKIYLIKVKILKLLFILFQILYFSGTYIYGNKTVCIKTGPTIENNLKYNKNGIWKSISNFINFSNLFFMDFACDLIRPYMVIFIAIIVCFLSIEIGLLIFIAYSIHFGFESFNSEQYLLLIIIVVGIFRIYLKNK